MGPMVVKKDTTTDTNQKVVIKENQSFFEIPQPKGSQESQKKDVLLESSAILADVQMSEEIDLNPNETN